jgi:K+-transporting ATPase ATPase B chain
MWDRAIFRRAVADSFGKLDPRIQVRNPVMFIVEIGSVLTTVALFQQLFSRTGNPLFTGQVAFWLWFTVIFANFAEAMAEGRGKAQADALRRGRIEATARRLTRRLCERAIGSSSRRPASFPATAPSSKASRRWTSRRSPESPLP